MADLARYAGGSGEVARARREGGAPVGRSVDEGDWSGTVLGRDSLGLTPRADGGEPFSESVRTLRGVRRRDTSYSRSRLGWIAQVGGVLVAVSDQPLVPRSDGRFQAADGWGAVELTWHAVTRPPDRRTGDVAQDTVLAHQETPAPRDTAPGGLGELSDLAYLPGPLRQSVLARLEGADLADVHAVRWTRPDGSSYHTVSGLVLRGTEGIALRATRQAGAPTWQAEQLSYSFVQQRPAVTGGADGSRPKLV
ncbi:hypothetical protein [Ornithinimicrobium cavernae]|uniref:hypothetical protein n=1 Tax=Ornithinimicrobium cavernae TaxID=2666047 RepID=UPI000D69EF43|nr:hypothetical protein [Ornithinimicrobium cavernae]